MITKEPLARELYNILACPLCKADVQYNTDKTGLICLNCRKVYPIRGNIPIMMVE